MMQSQKLAKAIRVLKEKKQEEVARAIGCSQPFYSDWELGKRAITRKDLMKLAEFLEIDPALLGCEEVEGARIDA